jgi:hypothetical protein
MNHVCLMPYNSLGDIIAYPDTPLMNIFELAQLAPAMRDPGFKARIPYPASHIFHPVSRIPYPASSCQLPGPKVTPCDPQFVVKAKKCIIASL